MSDTDYAGRIDALYERFERDREAFGPPAEADPDRALAFLREGVGPAVSLYVEARTGGPPAPIPPASFRRLEAAMNGWLELYARCHGQAITAEFPVRVAAELLVDTHDITDVARILTRVPPRATP